MADAIRTRVVGRSRFHTDIKEDDPIAPLEEVQILSHDPIPAHYPMISSYGGCCYKIPTCQTNGNCGYCELLEEVQAIKRYCKELYRKQVPFLLKTWSQHSTSTKTTHQHSKAKAFEILTAFISFCGAD